MSHNLVKVDSEVAQRDGSVTISTLSIFYIPDSANANNILEYNDPNWSLLEHAPASKTLVYSKYYATTNVGTTNYNYSNGDYFVWRTQTSVQPDEYLVSGVSAQAASSSQSPLTSNGTWKQSIRISNSGTYLFIYRPAFGSSFTSNDSCTVEIYDETSSFTNKLHINSEGKFGDCIFGIKTITTATIFKLIVSNIVGTVDLLEQDSRMLLGIQIFKLS